MKDNLKDLKPETLVYLIDSPDAKPDFKREELIAEINRRDIPAELLQEIVENENKMIARMMLETDDLLSEEVVMHSSHFLSEDEMKEIYIDQLDEYMRFKQGFRFDVWKYAIGG